MAQGRIAGGHSPRHPAAADALWIALALAVGLVAFLVRERLIAGRHGFPLDDAWIHLHFARNLAEGNGFAYNPGIPVSGSTAPLWTLLLGGLFWAGGSDPRWVKLLGTAGALIAALLARALALEWSRDRQVATLAGMLVALSGPMLWGALSGMEVTLAASLVAGALLCHARGRTIGSATLLGLAVLARPETSLVVPLMVLAGPLTLHRIGLLVGVIALPIAPWVAFNLGTVGAVLPASAGAKVEGGLVAFLQGSSEPLARALMERPLEFESEWLWMLWSVNAAVTCLLIPGLWALWRRRGHHDGLPALVLLLHPLGMALLAPYRGPSFQEGRYAIHLLPLATVVATMALTLGESRGAYGREARPRRALRARTARAVAGSALIAAAALALWPAAGRYAWAVQNIEEMQVSLGRWVDERTPPGARLALNDVGAIAYFSRRPVVDLIGLVTPAIIPYRREGDAGVLRFLGQACPDYLIVFPAWFPELAGRADHFRPVHRVRLAHNTVAGADEMVVYETAWNRWRQGPRPCG